MIGIILYQDVHSEYEVISMRNKMIILHSKKNHLDTINSSFEHINKFEFNKTTVFDDQLQKI